MKGFIFMFNSNWDVLIRVLTALVTLVTALAGLLKSDGGKRTSIHEESEILINLPEGSAAHKKMQSLLEAEIVELANRRKWRRDWPMAIVSLILAPSLGYLALWLTQQKTWWRWALATPVALFSFVFLYGLFECIQLAPRNEKGIRKR